jgi:DUF4097 and DUF4098 domain-containing protein YvlB
MRARYPTRTALLLTAALALGSGHAAAQQRIDQTIPTAAGGEVEIVNTAGNVRVVGWNRNEIRITGTLGQGSERLDVSGGRERTEIRVIIPRGARNVRGTDLEVRVPAGKSVTVRGTSADVSVREVTGPVTARSTSGDVTVTGSPSEVTAGSTSGDVVVEGTNARRVRASSTSGDVRVRGQVRESVNVESVSGDLTVQASTPEVRAKTVSGDMLLQGVSGRVSASTVSGDTRIRDSRIQFGSFESVSGNLRFEGDLPRGAAFNIQSHSGDIELHLPAGVSSDFEARTFSGQIVTDFAATLQPSARGGREREMRFTVGAGGGMVSLRTFSGNVKLLRR